MNPSATSSSERRYWILVASKDHVLKGRKEGFAQACHGKASPLKKIKAGDQIIYYSSKLFFGQPDKCQAFTAIGHVKNGEVYQFELSPNFHPFRIDVDFYPSQDASILPLIEHLDFIKNKQHWGYPFRWGILEIKSSDFQQIATRMLIDPSTNTPL